MSISQRGTLFVFISAVLYSLGGLFIKMIPWSGIAVNGGRTIVTAVLIGAYLLITKQPLKFNRWVALGAICVSSTNLLFAVANKMTTAANSIVLQFTAPVFVIIFSLILLKKYPKRLEVITCAAVLAGILCFFIDSIETGGGLGNILAVLSGVAYAGVFMLNDMPNGDSISSVFWGSVIGAVIGLPFIMMETDFSAGTLTNVLILGIFQMGLGYIFLTIGLKTTAPVTAVLVSGIEPILNPLLVACFYQEAMGKFSLVGSIIVIGSIVTYNIILSRESKNTQ